ncbi:ATP-dependent RecD-like DNA helicase [Hyphococcus flavus]|uniref:ATP-dependent RecD-like DNA helicase n=1 Tax=Hyphococcus flavus TaxID=1866326 RepID=A0AAE9ZCV0_9PROT|nr:ATP-dependent RecD-like DNA helicase [Hyphococcus flavus]WDI30622.1 ATP-dependent RecD-like DNA helicase [Hyphococcus flavus]
MNWSPEQDNALLEVERWRKAGESQVFRLFGYAGAGKTTLARHIAENAGGDVAFGAFTGKAAHVMRQKGCVGATTIHSLIYRPASSEGEDEPQFAIRHDAPAADADLIVIDECSMVDEELGRDLLSFNKPVLVLGDPAQLPPVKGGGFFTEGEPDFMLTEIHRQAADNPIIRLSMAIRAGEPFDEHSDECRLISRKDISTEAIMEADQILVGANRTRKRYNDRLRELHGYSGSSPESGEKLVCLRNNKKKGLLNGGIWSVENQMKPKGQRVRFIVRPEEGGKSVKVSVPRGFFIDGPESVPWLQRKGADEFDYGYALTVHKAQGSQWDNIVLFDESFMFREHAARWLYTGVTRAAERLTLVR